MLSSLWKYIISKPISFLLIIVAIVLTAYYGLRLMRYIHRLYMAKRLIFLRITLAREESPKDKDKQVEKDFRERISIMSQFFRNLHETMELNMWNQFKVWLFRHNIFSFELVAHQKVVDFYISTPKYYKEIVEKGITSYYPDANIEPIEEYETMLKDAKMKGYYAYTERKYWFPVKTFKVIENDPLNNLTNVFSKLESNETAIIQIVVRPKNDKWTKKAEEAGETYFKGKKLGGIKIPVIGWIFNVFKGIFLGYEKMEIQPKQSGDGYVRMLQSKEEVAKRMGEKSAQSGFDTVIRLLSTAKTEKRAEEISNNIIVGLSLFKDPSSNWFQTRRIFFIDSINDWWFKFNFKKRMIDCRFFGIGEKTEILAEDELASLFHFPSSKYNYSPDIRWMDYKVLPAPTNIPEEGILIGHNVYRGDKKEIRFLKQDRSRHHYIIGKSGSGKSALLSYMARQDIQNGEGVCVIDPHGDLIEDILTYIPKERAKDVIIFDPADQERPMGLNMLDAVNSAEMDLIS
ncbi:MAG: DUF87 domain-containing protein, partial [Nitrospirae bacterium]|nr:DUF87 domain-containing protein [Nitrospirota bacterium]